MTELVLRNFDRTVLEKLDLSPEARVAFANLLRGRLVQKGGRPAPRPAEQTTDMDLYSGA
jgi:hypothetical protein